jgi:peptide/nickel transport system substrate-binding protein
VVYVKNPDYYDAPKPYFDRIVAPIITNSNVSLTAFTAQKIYSGISMNATQAQTLKAQIPELQWAQEGTAQQSITFNVTRAPWNNVKVRQAISMALDRQGFINTALLGFGRLEATSRVWFSDAAPSDDDLRAANNGNVTAARELLAAAGYPNGFDGGQLLVAPGTGGDEQPAWIADQLKRNLNIALVLDHPEYAIGYDRFQKSDFGISYGVYARSYSDPDDYLYARYRTGAARNYSNCSDPELDQMLDRQRTLVDTAQRNALIKDIDRYFMANVVCSITMPSTTDWFPWWPNVKNFTPHISFGGGDLTSAWLETP